MSDTLFSWVDLQAKLNSELLNNLGNFVNRVLSFIAKDPGMSVRCLLWDITQSPLLICFCCCHLSSSSVLVGLIHIDNSKLWQLISSVFISPVSLIHVLDDMFCYAVSCFSVTYFLIDSSSGWLMKIIVSLSCESTKWFT